MLRIICVIRKRRFAAHHLRDYGICLVALLDANWIQAWQRAPGNIKFCFLQFSQFCWFAVDLWLMAAGVRS